MVPRVGEAGSTGETARAVYFKLQLQQAAEHSRAPGQATRPTVRVSVAPTPAAPKDRRDAQRRALLPVLVLQMGGRASARRLGVGGECKQVSVLWQGSRRHHLALVLPSPRGSE